MGSTEAPAECDRLRRLESTPTGRPLYRQVSSSKGPDTSSNANASGGIQLPDPLPNHGSNSLKVLSLPFRAQNRCPQTCPQRRAKRIVSIAAISCWLRSIRGAGSHGWEGTVLGAGADVAVATRIVDSTVRLSQLEKHRFESSLIKKMKRVQDS